MSDLFFYYTDPEVAPVISQLCGSCRQLELTTVLQRWLDLPAERAVLPVRRMGVRVLCLANRVGTAWTHPVQVIVVVRVRVHVLSRVRLLCLVEILRAVERALAAVEAHVRG